MTPEDSNMSEGDGRSDEDCREIERLEIRLSQSKKLYEMTLRNEMDWMRRWEASDKRVKKLSAENDRLVERSVGAMAIAEGDECWEQVNCNCPLLIEVRTLRLNYNEARKLLTTRVEASRLDEAVTQLRETRVVRDEWCAEYVKARAALLKIREATEGFADGAPDATAHDKLCNEITAMVREVIADDDENRNDL